MEHIKKKNTAYGVRIPLSTTIQVKNKDDSQIKSDQKTDVIDSVMSPTPNTDTVVEMNENE